MNKDELRSLIRDIPDYPSPGILFRDITPLLRDGEALTAVAELMSAEDPKAKLIAGIEARGFFFAAAIGVQSKRGVIPIRKKGKLPHDVHRQEYGLEYGSDVIEIHKDAAKPGETVLLVDDVLATGGTLAAAIKLIHATGAVVTSIGVLLEIAALGGREKLRAEFP
ncbi:MAG: adenine phosphoribosyltransferase, partial [Candidatus Nanopelagicaceae bacterium]